MSAVCLVFFLCILAVDSQLIYPANNDGQQTLQDMLHILESQKKNSDLILLRQANITNICKYIDSFLITIKGGSLFSLFVIMWKIIRVAHGVFKKNQSIYQRDIFLNGSSSMSLYVYPHFIRRFRPTIGSSKNIVQAKQVSYHK